MRFRVESNRPVQLVFWEGEEYLIILTDFILVKRTQHFVNSVRLVVHKCFLYQQIFVRMTKPIKKHRSVRTYMADLRTAVEWLMAWDYCIIWKSMTFQ